MTKAVPSVLRAALALALGVPGWAQELGPAPIPPPASSTPRAASEWSEPRNAYSSAVPINTQDRAAVAALYRDVFLPTNTVALGFTGNVATGIAGTTSAAYKDAVLTRINFFRSLAGVPADVTFSDTYSRKNQQAALMMSANRALSHNPPADWQFRTPDAVEAAANSNLCLYYGYATFYRDPGCVRGYMEDSGANNTVVGHRRWLLHPQTRVMGTGDVDEGNGYPFANSIWVFDGNTFGPRPATRDPFIAWPPRGFVPFPLLFPRWSFAVPGANFANATVTLTRGGEDLPVTIESREAGYGDPAIVFSSSGVALRAGRSADITYTVTVGNVLVGGQPRSFTYDVTDFDPNFSPAPGARPAIAANGVVNAASFSPDSVLGQGSFFALFGTNLSPTTRDWSRAFAGNRAPTTLDGVRVLIGSQEAFLSFVSPTQINGFVPAAVPTGPVPVRVVNANGQSDAVTVNRSLVSPALFTTATNGRTYAAGADRTYRPGDALVVFGTGFGATLPDVPAGTVPGAPALLSSGVAATLGNVPAVVDFAGLSTQIGVYQFNLRVPQLPPGEYELVLQVGGVPSQRGVLVRVQ